MKLVKLLVNLNLLLTLQGQQEKKHINTLLDLLLILCVVVDAGWFGFGPGEFHRWQTLDMHLPVHKVHLDALNELKRDYNMHFSIPNTHNVPL